jgi:hypothetical protein
MLTDDPQAIEESDLEGRAESPRSTSEEQPELRSARRPVQSSGESLAIRVKRVPQSAEGPETV